MQSVVKVSVKMKRRTSRRQSRLGILFIIIVVIVVVTITMVRSSNLRAKSERLAVTERQLEQQIEDAKKETKALEEKEAYMQTKKYIEDEAKDKLGLVYPDEIVIEPSPD